MGQNKHPRNHSLSQFRNLLDTTIQKNYHNKIRLSQRNPCKIKVFLGCSYYTAISFQYVPELRELIQGCLTDKVSDSFWITVFIFLLAADDSWIVVHLEHQAFHLVLAHQFCFSLFGIHVHAAEFIDFELLSVLADTHL